MKYYFITYQAANRAGSISIWNDVIDTSPMEFIKHLQEIEINGSNTYKNFVVINTCEISKEDFSKYVNQF